MLSEKTLLLAETFFSKLQTPNSKLLNSSLQIHLKRSAPDTERIFYVVQ